jgi:hypothetical protein
MEDCAKHIKEQRPKLSESSVKTFCNILRNLWSSEFDYKNLIKHQDHVMNHLEHIKYTTRKTILSALVSISSGTIQNTYRKLMIEDASKYNVLQRENKMTPEQRENWMSWKDILDILDKLKTKYYYIFKEKKPSQEDILNLQKYIILSVYTSIPPRRSQDFCLMKVKGYDKEKDNYYDKGKFNFRIYKTAKFSGLQIEKVPKSLEILLRKWMTFKPNDYLFSDWYEKPLTSSGMTKILNSIFGKNVSVNQLRHVYITEKMGPMIKELENTAEKMGHSVNQQKLYVKND